MRTQMYLSICKRMLDILGVRESRLLGWTPAQVGCRASRRIARDPVWHEASRGKGIAEIGAMRCECESFAFWHVRACHDDRGLGIGGVYIIDYRVDSESIPPDKIIDGLEADAYHLL
jgi:hypothetical protein